MVALVHGIGIGIEQDLLIDVQILGFQGLRCHLDHQLPQADGAFLAYTIAVEGDRGVFDEDARPQPEH